jgi:hypothetical protein
MVVKCEVVDVLQETGSFLVRLLSGAYDEAQLPTTSAQCPRLAAQNLTQIVPLAPHPDGTPRTKFVLFVDTDFQTNLIPVRSCVELMASRGDAGRGFRARGVCDSIAAFASLAACLVGCRAS